MHPCPLHKALQPLKAFWRDNKSWCLFLVLMVLFRSAIADWNHVPTGSMKPTIVEGDRIVINKLAYDIQLPLVNYSLLTLADPERGDIVVFESDVAKKRLVKRVIGIPGDRVAMINNQLTLNGTALEYDELNHTTDTTDYLEKSAHLEHAIRTNNQHHPIANFSTVIVPAGHYLVMGDNRDNSADSRVIGFVPRREIIGKTSRVAWSLDAEHYYLPRTERFFRQL